MISLDTGLWQRGPSGSFSPLSLSPLAWWDWSDTSNLYTDSGLTTLVSADGDPLGGIKDKSGNNYHLTQTDGTAKGLYKTNIKNGKSVGRTDGVNDCWSVPSSKAAFKSIHYTGATLFFAGKAGVVSNPNALYAVCGNMANSSHVGFLFGMEDDVNITKGARAIIYSTSGNNADTYTASAAYANTFPPNTSVISCLKTDPGNATLANRISIYLNGGSVINGNTDSGSASSLDAEQDIRVGATVNGAGAPSKFAPADFYELLIFPTLLSDANRVLVRNYLNAKWAVY